MTGQSASAAPGGARELIRGLGWQIAVFLGLGALTVACVQSGPLLIAWAINHARAPRAAAEIGIVAVAYVVLNVSGAGLNALQIRLASRLTERIIARLKDHLYGHVMKLDAQYFERTPDGALLSRLTSDVEIIAIFLRSDLVQAATNLLVLIVTTVFLAVLSPLLALVVFALIVPVAVLGTRRFQSRAEQANGALRAEVAGVTAELTEGVAGIAVTRRFGRAVDQIDRYGMRNRRRLSAMARANALASTYGSVIDFISILAYVPVIAVGAWLYTNGHLSVGAIVAFVVYIGTFFDPIQSLTQVYAEAQVALAAYGRCREILAEPVLPPPPRVPRKLPASGDLALESVTFGYADGWPLVLHGLSLTVHPGDRLALVGHSGAGKTTVARLLSGTLWPRSGAVTFGGVNLADATGADLRARIAAVPQSTHIFAGSIRDNLRLSGADDESIEQMCQLLAKLGIRDADPARDHTSPAAERPPLSAGQRQLVSLARALLLSPAMLILDEPTADIDEDTAAAVDLLLAEQAPERAVVVVAHRVQTARRFDRVVVMNDGRIVQDGRSRDLERVHGPFRSLIEAG